MFAALQNFLPHLIRTWPQRILLALLIVCFINVVYSLGGNWGSSSNVKSINDGKWPRWQSNGVFSIDGYLIFGQVNAHGPFSNFAKAHAPITTSEPPMYFSTTWNGGRAAIMWGTDITRSYDCRVVPGIFIDRSSGVAIQWRLLTLVFLLPTALLSLRSWRRTSRLIKSNCCAACGYDLRATPGAGVRSVGPLRSGQWVMLDQSSRRATALRRGCLVEGRGTTEAGSISSHQ